MGVIASATVWTNSKASGSTLLVALAIADHADDGGFAWPSVTTLAKKARVSLRTAQYALRELVGLGELNIEAQAGPRGCNAYRLMLDNMRSGAGKSSHAIPAGAQSTTARGATGCTRTIKGNINERRGEGVRVHEGDGSIRLNHETQEFEGITDNLKAMWREAFPAVDVDAELSVASMWASGDDGDPIRNPAAFLLSWLSNKQNKAPRQQAPQRHQPAARRREAPDLAATFPTFDFSSDEPM